MTRKSVMRSLLAAAVLGLGTIVAPGLASAAHTSAAPIQPVDPNTLAQYGSDMPALASNGSMVETGNAWCDPLTNQCLAHAWTTRGHYD
jgi:hypothetical protein